MRARRPRGGRGSLPEATARDFHTREDLDKPENRVNVALFGALAIPEVHRWLRTALGLTVPVAFVPPPNQGTRRPDLRIEAADGTTLGWVEVELGHDPGQIDDYRAAFAEPVYALWGRGRPGADATLEALAEAIGTMAIDDLQHRRQAAFLRTLIDEALAGYRPGSKRSQVSDEVRARPWVRAVLDAIGRDLVDDACGDRVRPGRVGITTNGPWGLSLRAYSPLSTKGSVSLLSMQSGKDVVKVRGADHLKRYLPHRHAAVDAWLELVGRLGVRGPSVVVVAVDRVEVHATEVGAAIRRIVDTGP